MRHAMAVAAEKVATCTGSAPAIGRVAAAAERVLFLPLGLEHVLQPPRHVARLLLRDRLRQRRVRLLRARQVQLEARHSGRVSLRVLFQMVY